MLRKVCAWSLFLLAVSPFTAPFATCDLETLISSHAYSPEAITVAHPPLLVSGRDALTVAPLVERTTFARPVLSWSPALGPAAADASPAARITIHLRRGEEGSPPLREDPARPTVLRI
jgi:hypothetical protein